MDFTKILPVEVSQKIFSYLSAEDLWRALKVTKTWKHIANSNTLWKPVCYLDNLDLDSDVPAQGRPYRDLCDYGRVWASWRWGAVQNWERSQYIQAEIPSMMFTDFFVSSYRDKLAISNGCSVYVYSRDKQLIMTDFREAFGDGGVRDVEMNKDHLLVLQQTCVIIYKTANFSPYLLLGFSNSGNQFQIHNEFAGEAYNFEQWALEFAFLYDEVLWVGPYLFIKSAVIVDLNTRTHKVVEFPWKCTLLRANENVIARSDIRLAVYSLGGDKLFETDCMNYCWIKTSKSVLILVADNFIETYHRTTGQKLKTINKSFFELTVNYNRDVLFGIEKTNRKFNVTIEAINLNTGETQWTLTLGGEYSSEIRLFLNSFLCYDCTHSRHWYIIDTKNGNCLFKRVLPVEGKIIYISSYFWICQFPDKVVVRYY